LLIIRHTSTFQSASLEVSVTKERVEF
jgi:hypothetical protein